MSKPFWKWPMRDGADCENCPLRDRPVSSPEKAKGKPLFAIVGEGPGKTEVAVGFPFRGKSGILLNDAIRKADTHRSVAHIDNATLCLPKKHMTDAEWTKALACCRPRLAKNLKQLKPNSFVLLLGEKAMNAVSGSTKTLKNWRGYPLDVEAIRPEIRNDLHYMATWHPAFILREMHHLPFLKMEMNRGLWINGKPRSEWEWKWPPRIWRDPREREEALRALLDEPVISLDVENAEEHPMFAPLICIGLGTEKFSVTVRYPLTPTEDNLIRQILMDPKRTVIMQNNNHDRLSMDAHGYEIACKIDDTLDMLCIIASQVPHDLGTSHNWYYFADRWKTKFHSGDDKKGAKSFSNKPYDDLADYNGKDCISTAQLRAKCIKEINRYPYRQRLYEQSMELQDMSMEMTKRGIRMDLKRRAEHSEILAKYAQAEEEAFMAIAKKQGLGDDYLVDGVKKFITSRRMTDLFYKKLGVQCRHWSPKTGDEALTKNALRDMIGSGRPDVSALARHTFMHRQWSKLKSTYADGLQPVGEYLHVMWSAARKKTRRWGSSPNLQNIPYAIWKEVIKEDPNYTIYQRLIAMGLPTFEKDGKLHVLMRPGMRDMFIPDDGYSLVAADYSQLELRIIALLAGDEILLNAYKTGKDVHEINTRMLFAIKDEEKVPKHMRRLGKNYVYGCNYGAKPRTVWLNLLPDFPGLSQQLVEHMHTKWFEIHHWITQFQKEQYAFGKKHGYVEMPFSGHRFTFYWGAVKPTTATNFPIQGTAADIMNAACIRVRRRLRKEGDWAHVVGQIHDELLCQAPTGREEELGKILVEEMHTELEYQGRVLDFPVDPKAGPNWEKMEEFNVAA